MAEQKIEFRKIRDFGENLNDTFLFIRGNFVPLLKAFFALCAIFLIAQAIFLNIYQSNSLGMFDQLRRGMRLNKWQVFDVFTPVYFLVLLFGWLSYTSMKVTVGAYIKYYVENNGAIPDIEAVWEIFKRYFLKVFFYSIPVLLVIALGYMFCILPGIYFTVVLVPFEMVLMMEDASFGSAWNRCITIIKQEFWASLGTYLVVGLIYWFSGFIITGVLSAVIGVATYFSTGNTRTTFNVIYSFFGIFSNVFYIIFYVSVAFHYFNLVERKDGTGLLGRINSIGGSKGNYNNIEEQF